MYRIMMNIIACDGVTRAELAERTGMSERTVQRYITELVRAGIPIVSGSGKFGGYRVTPGFRLTSEMLTPEEIDRIRVCLSALAGTFKDDLTSEVLDKLAALSGDGEPESLVVDFDNWNGEGPSPKEDAMTTAIRNRISVDMQYADKSGAVTRRLFDPYCVALKEGVRYVYGKCHLHGDFRLFRLARVKSVELTDRRFERDENADVRDAFIIEGGLVDLELEFDESARAGVEEWLGSRSVTEGVRPTAKARVYGGGELVRRILSFGPAVKVLAPDDIAVRVAAEAARIAAVYRGE